MEVIFHDKGESQPANTAAAASLDSGMGSHGGLSLLAKVANEVSKDAFAGDLGDIIKVPDVELDFEADSDPDFFNK